jgi:hypothetical protein
MKIRLAVLLLGLAFLVQGVPVGAADAPHGMYTPDAIKWGDPPPFVPKGAKLAVL